MKSLKPHAARQRHPLSVFIAALAASLGGGLLLAGTAQAQSLTTYDDFAGGAISPYRWQGEEGKQYGGTRVEARRVISAGQLRIEAKGYSDNYSNTGTSTTRNSVVFAKSSAITTIRSTVTMRTATVSACAGNSTPSSARARIFGFFFNAGDSVPGSNYNDVYAGIQVFRASNSTDASGIMRVSAFVGQCTDDSCIGSTTLASQDMGTVALNTPVDLQVTWNAAGNRFTFQRDVQTAIDLAYTVADAKPASFPAKRLEISDQIAHCTAARIFTYGGADFDNVKTNALPALARLRTDLRELPPAASFDEAVGRVD